MDDRSRRCQPRPSVDVGARTDCVLARQWRAVPPAAMVSSVLFGWFRRRYFQSAVSMVQWVVLQWIITDCTVPDVTVPAVPGAASGVDTAAGQKRL